MSGNYSVKTEGRIAKTTSAFHFNNGLYLWVIIAGSFGLAVILIVMIAIVVYLKRKKKKKKKPYESEGIDCVVGGEFYYKPRNRLSLLSTGSEGDMTSEIPNTQGSTISKALRHWTSLEIPRILHLTPQCVQPKQPLNPWNSTSFPQCQSTTTVPGTLNTHVEERRTSDGEDVSSSPCLNGRLWFSIYFQPDDEELKVTLIKAKYLPGRGLDHTPRDPYVKIFLLPDEEICYQSKIRKRTLSPKFNETFMFKIKPKGLKERSVRFSMYDVDKRKIRHNLGHVIFPLNRSELLGGQVIWKDLDTLVQQPSSLGEIQLGLGYSPYTNRIKTVVGKVRNIQGLTTDDTSVYVKVHLQHGHKMMKSKRTVPQPIIYDMPSEQLEWQFDEAFNFGVSGGFFDSCSFTFTVILANPSPFLIEKVHGRVIIGSFMYARGEQLKHWQDVLSNQCTIVTRWHNLEPIISN